MKQVAILRIVQPLEKENFMLVLCGMVGILVGFLLLIPLILDVRHPKSEHPGALYFCGVLGLICICLSAGAIHVGINYPNGCPPRGVFLMDGVTGHPFDMLWRTGNPPRRTNEPLMKMNIIQLYGVTGQN